ncbi:Glycosyl hydrolases family 6 [Phytophthora infestans]|uniref:Glycosyl hydrolases family 6 n=1 Tax=Phytophthora infestans TaxID=4787 RepID=A0A833S3Z0_PHYIN|nr:Glycosyl hydrolases family 6 [Phytophthora infestans]
MALTLSSIGLSSAEELCSIPPYSYTGAKQSHPELTTAIETLENYAIASWFTDRQSTDERSTTISDMLSQCSEDTRLSVVVYGIPNKDCAAGLSSEGSVKSTDDYKAFLQELTDAVGDRKVLYVVEPDALGLLTQDGGCGASAGYLDNLKVAVAALSANANAELYVDIGYWMLAYPDSASKVATAMKDIGSSGRVKGVTINTSNYRSNDECADYCTNFQTAMGSTDMKCIVDTSRNYNGSPTSDWCNVPTAGIGKPPTSETGISNIDYFMWIKPPGERREQGMSKIGDGSGTPAGTAYPTSSSTGSSSQSSTDQTPPSPTPTTDNSSWNQEQTAGTVAPADTTPATQETATPSMAPVPESTAPSTSIPVTMTPSTTEPVTEVLVVPSQIACKAKKRLRSRN